MSDPPCGAPAHHTPLCHPPSDPARQARRIPVRIVKMLTAHSGHLLHPEYLQPLTSAPVSIELDAKKSPLALLAQTCSQIGKPDPPPPSKLSSLSSSSLGDKESRSSSSGLKLVEHRQPLEDKSSFKPYSKSGGGDGRKEGLGRDAADKTGFRVPGGNNGGGSASCPSFPPPPPPPHAASPNTQGASPQHPPAGMAASPSLNTDLKAPGGDSVGSESSGGSSKKELEQCKPSPDVALLANSSHARASANSSSASSDCSPHHDVKVDTQSTAPPLGNGHVAPVSPFKPGHSVFPLPPSGLGYHGSIVGAYAGYPSQYVPGLDPAKSKSSPLTGASPPSFMQSLCRDPYCLTYPNASHLGGSNCSSCVHDPSSALKSSGFPLVYPPHPLHSLHPGMAPSLSHPLCSYGFMLPNEPLPHACNWVSAGGPCDKRFSTSEELLSHLRTHTALPGMDSGKLLSAYPSSAAAACHLHLAPQGSPGSFALRGPPSLGLARYHPYSKAHLPAAPSLPMHSLPASAPYYSPYALYSQRLGSASALGYQ